MKTQHQHSNMLPAELHTAIDNIIDLTNGTKWYVEIWEDAILLVEKDVVVEHTRLPGDYREPKGITMRRGRMERTPENVQKIAEAKSLEGLLAVFGK